MRSSVFILAVIVLAGCGKSFQEADAIYKDEVAKLKALEREISDDADSASKAAYDQYLADNRVPDKENQELDAAAEAMRAAAQELERTNKTARTKAWLASEALEKKVKSQNWGTEEQKKAEAEEKFAAEAYRIAEKAVKEASGKATKATQKSEEAAARLQSIIDGLKNKASEAGRMAKLEVRERRLPEINAQQKVVDAAYQAKEAAK